MGAVNLITKDNNVKFSSGIGIILRTKIELFGLNIFFLIIKKANRNEEKYLILKSMFVTPLVADRGLHVTLYEMFLFWLPNFEIISF